MKKRVLIVGYKPPPYHGVVRMTEILNNSNLLNSEFNVEVFYLKAVDNAEDRGKIAFRNIFFNFENIFRFFLKCFFQKYNVLYLSVAQNKMGFIRDSLLILIAKIFNIKILAQYHAGDFFKNYSHQGNFLKHYTRYIYNKKIDILIVLAEQIKKQVIECIGNNFNILVLPNFIEDSFIPNEYIKKDVKKDVKILFIGYISKAKGAVDLAKAAKIVIQKLRDLQIEFFLAGDFVYKEKNITYIDDFDVDNFDIKKYIFDNKIAENVKLLGYINNEEKIRYLKEADLFVLPSYSEGFPVSVLEAMSYSLPMVLTPVGAMDEVLTDKENCLFVNVGNYEELADKIIYLIQNKDVANDMGNNNYFKVKNNYCLSKYEKEVVKIFKEVLQKC